MSSSSPEAKPAKPKDAQDPSEAMGRHSDLVVSSDEQEKQPANDATSTPQADLDGAAAGRSSKVEASAPTTTSSQTPVSSPSSEKPPLLSSDSKPTRPTGKSNTKSDPEKRRVTAATTATPGAPAKSGSRVPDAQEQRRRKRRLIIHILLAKFFTWILLLGFVVFPSTFSRFLPVNDTQSSAGGSEGGGVNTTNANANLILNIGLYVIGFVCCLFNAVAVGWLWYLKKDDPQWLFTNLFSAGLVNAFTGLIMTFLNIFVMPGVTLGTTSATSTLVLAAVCTLVYAVLTAIYARKRMRARQRRRNRAARMV